MLSGYIRHKMTVKLSFSSNKINVLLNPNQFFAVKMLYWSSFNILNNCVRCNISTEKNMCIPNRGYISGILYAVLMMMVI